MKEERNPEIQGIICTEEKILILWDKLLQPWKQTYDFYFENKRMTMKFV